MAHPASWLLCAPVLLSGLPTPRRALDRQAYLAEVSALPDDEVLNQRFLDSAALADRRFTPLPLRNELLPGPGPGAHWGKFWLEALDPCHRQLAGFYKDYLDSRPAAPSIRGFFLWLGSQAVPDSLPAVRYLSDAELAPLRVTARGGLLVHGDRGGTVNTRDGVRSLFVIDLAKQLYLAAWKEGIFHTSLSRGRPVLGAGLLRVRDGVVQTLSFESGHYRPTLEQGHATVVLLAEMGTRFADPLEIVYFEGGRKCHGLVGARDLASLERFHKALGTRKGAASLPADGR